MKDYLMSVLDKYENGDEFNPSYVDIDKLIKTKFG